MRNTKVQGVGLAMPSDHAFPREVLRGALKGLRGARVPAFYVADVAALKRWPAEVRGLILVLSDAQWIGRLRRVRRPVVNVGTTLPPEFLASVVTDNRAIGRMAAEHLWDRGYRRFAYLGLPDEYFFDRERLSGFAEGLAQRGAVCEEIMPERLAQRARPRRQPFVGQRPFYEAVPAAVFEERKKQILRWLRRATKPVAVLAANDVPAVELLQHCAAARVSVPREVGVLGVGNDELCCELSTPPLSSIDQNAMHIGYQAVTLLLRLMTGEPRPDGPLLVPPRRVVVRESSGATVSADSELAPVLEFIWQHGGRLRSVDELCRHFPFSRRSLELRFEKHLGRGPAKEIQRVRVEHAKTLLAETDETLKAVAADLGFRSLCHFVYVFRRQIGITPAEYRGQNRLREEAVLLLPSPLAGEGRG